MSKQIETKTMTETRYAAVYDIHIIRNVLYVTN